MGFADIVKYTIYLTDPARFDGFVSAAAKLTSPPPAAMLLHVRPSPRPQC